MSAIFPSSLSGKLQRYLDLAVPSVFRPVHLTFTTTTMHWNRGCKTLLNPMDSWRKKFNVISPELSIAFDFFISFYLKLSPFFCDLTPVLSLLRLFWESLCASSLNAVILAEAFSGLLTVHSLPRPSHPLLRFQSYPMIHRSSLSIPAPLLNSVSLPLEALNTPNSHCP